MALSYDTRRLLVLRAVQKTPEHPIPELPAQSLATSVTGALVQAAKVAANAPDEETTAKVVIRCVQNAIRDVQADFRITAFETPTCKATESQIEQAGISLAAQVRKEFSDFLDENPDLDTPQPTPDPGVSAQMAGYLRARQAASTGLTQVIPPSFGAGKPEQVLHDYQAQLLKAMALTNQQVIAQAPYSRGGWGHGYATTAGATGAVTHAAGGAPDLPAEDRSTDEPLPAPDQPVGKGLWGRLKAKGWTVVP